MQNYIKKVSKAIESLSRLSTANISDAMSKRLEDKLLSQTMDSAIRPLSDSFKICAPAFTVSCYPGATYAMEKAINQAPAGSVIVCDGHACDAGVLMGGLMSTLAQRRGVVGAVIDGAVRDVEDILELDFPVFSRYVTPKSGTFAQLGDVDMPITCGSVIVNPEDIIVADVNGVIVVPSSLAGLVASESQKLHEFEENIRQRILDGFSLDEALAGIEDSVSYNSNYVRKCDKN